MPFGAATPALLLLLLIGSGSAFAGPEDRTAASKPDPVTTAADRAVAAADKGDQLSLRILVQAAEPDPWLVVESLLYRERADVARALAAVCTHADVGALGAYVERVGRTRRVRRREDELARAGRALESGRPKEVLASLATLDVAQVDVSTAVALYVRGVARRQLAKATSAPVADLQAAADVAARVGWLRMAWRAREAAARTLIDGGALAAAGPELTAARALAEKRERAGDMARCDEALAVVASREARRQDAATHLASAIDGYARAGLRASVAHCEIAMGDLCSKAGDLEGARARYARALDALPRLPASEAPGIEAGARRGLGTALARLGSFGAAERELRRSLALAEAHELAVVRADVLANLGVVLLSRGAYAKALALGAEGLELHEALAEGEGRAQALMNLGLTHASLGKCDVAARYLERARQAFAALGDVGGEARVMSNLGVVLGARGDLDKALSLQRDALAHYRKVADPSGEALALGRLGHIHGQRGEYTEAIRHQHLSIRVKRQRRDRLGEAVSLESIGHLEQQLGNFAEAAARRKDSLYLANKLGASDLVARNHWGLAEIALLSATPDVALREAKAAVKALPDDYARGLFDEQGALARERWAGVHDVGMAAAAALEDPTSFLWFLERQRAATLLESLGGRDALLGATVPGPLRRAESDAREAEAWALRRYREAADAGKRGPIRKARAALSKARETLRESKERIAREAVDAARIVYPKPASGAELRRSLRAGDALVLYALLPDRAYAAVLTTRGTTLHDLGSSRAVLELMSGAQDVGSGSWSFRLIRRLQAMVVTPLGLDPKRVRRVFVSPDGALASLPFGLLLPKQTVTYVPSGSTLRWLRRERRGVKPGSGVLALGRPDYGARKVTAKDGGAQRGGARVAHPAGALPALEASAIEARAVGDVVLLDGAATETRLRTSLSKRKRWRAVHLACHGLVDFEHPLFSALALTPGDGSDGLLTTLEVFGMPVPADLVVLSACETGRGRLLRTEGVFGFTRAFLFAGSSRVLVSLWKVDDEATRALMVRFHELWKTEGKGKRRLTAAAALRAAQDHVRAQPRWADPYYWAAWQLWGLPD